MKLTKSQAAALAQVRAKGRCLVFAKKTASGIGRDVADALYAAGLITFTTDGYTNPQTGMRITFTYAVAK